MLSNSGSQQRHSRTYIFKRALYVTKFIDHTRVHCLWKESKTQQRSYSKFIFNLISQGRKFYICSISIFVIQIQGQFMSINFFFSRFLWYSWDKIFIVFYFAGGLEQNQTPCVINLPNASPEKTPSKTSKRKLYIEHVTY